MVRGWCSHGSGFTNCLSICLALSRNGGGDEAICSVEKNQFSSSKDETTKQDIDLEIKCFLKTSHIL